MEPMEASVAGSFGGFFGLFVCLFIYFWLCWVFVSVWGLSLVAASGGHSSSRCAGLSLLRPLLLRSTGSRRAGSVVVAHGPSFSTACGIFPDQGLNPCSLHWQADSQPLCHQGSPACLFLMGSWRPDLYLKPLDFEMLPLISSFFLKILLVWKAKGYILKAGSSSHFSLYH